MKRDNPLRLPRVRLEVPRVRFTVLREAGNPSGRALVHDGDVCRIGSHPSNDVVLADPMISRFHCRLVREAEGWRAYDAGSLNGTRLNGVKVRDAEIEDEAVLALGDTEIRVSTLEPGEDVSRPLTPQFGAMVGESVAMQRLFAVLERVAASDIDVLIEGESGTGKELVATEIVNRSGRAGRPFVVVDCGAMSPSLVESELFGHLRGAFTGAERDRVGAFEAASGGTVFLDEIGELPIELQPKLLRALEAREVRRLGETKARRIDVRVLAATHRDLEREVNRGRFREDLYFRLAKVAVRVPPVRERVEDLPLLVNAFLRAAGKEREASRLFTPEVVAQMQQYEWPGNVRELRNYVERAVVLGVVPPPSRRAATIPAPSVQGARPEGEAFGASEAPPPSGGSVLHLPVPDVSMLPYRLAKEAAVEAFEKAYIKPLLDRCEGNMSKAARSAGMDRMYLHQLAQKHGFRGGGHPKN